MAWTRQTRYLAQMLDGIPVPSLPAWRVFPGLSDYSSTVSAMERHVDAMTVGRAPEEIWLVEHAPVITAGTGAEPEDLLDAARFPVIATGRGGRHTYHGPGQRVIYPMLDLGRRGRDVRRYVAGLEGWAIEALGSLGVAAFTSSLGTGIWVQSPGGPSKIGAIGVRVRRWITFHGLSINVATNLEHFGTIVPCGIAEHGVARLADILPNVGMHGMDDAFKGALPNLLHSLAEVDDALLKALEAG